jgi:hypothetical protein
MKLDKREIGKALVFLGVLVGMDSGMGGVPGMASAAVGIAAMLLGVVLIRKSKPKS